MSFNTAADTIAYNYMGSWKMQYIVTVFNSMSAEI